MFARLSRVNRIHILVHPGFSSDPHFLGEPGIQEGSRTLARRYFMQARGMGRDELMVAISPASRAEFRQEAASGARLLGELRAILLERLIALSDRAYPGAPDDSGPLALRIARARGFGVSRWVRTVAYGEMLGECVERTAHSFNRSAGLRRKTEIDVGMTDFGLFYDSVGPDGLPELIRAGREKFPRVEYILPAGCK